VLTGIRHKITAALVALGVVVGLMTWFSPNADRRHGRVRVTIEVIVEPMRHAELTWQIGSEQNHISQRVGRWDVTRYAQPGDVVVIDVRSTDPGGMSYIECKIRVNWDVVRGPVRGRSACRLTMIVPPA